MIHNPIFNWFNQLNRAPFPFQTQAWEAINELKSGLINAPTGMGKTYAAYLGWLAKRMQSSTTQSGLRLLWITPIRSLSRDLVNAIEMANQALCPSVTVGVRSGDTSTETRAKQKQNWPEVLLTTPESLHLLIASNDHPALFEQMEMVVCDEWHELMSTKRGVQLELALSRLRAINPYLITWGISATIGNLDQAMHVLLGNNRNSGILIRAIRPGKTKIEVLLPETIEKFPWSGHLGIQMLPKVLDIIRRHGTTLVFTNTRSQTEIWYQNILEQAPDLAGLLAIHHASLDKELREWVEDNLAEGKLKAVVCTSSLDLGVDFKPVDAVIQIGSPKGVSRFMQRAGRSGHRPDAESIIYCVPTHSLEIMEGAALKLAAESGIFESREPIMKPPDVLMQYLMTLAVGNGFDADQTFNEVTSTHSYQYLERAEFNEILQYLITGGPSLEAYDEYKKLDFALGKWRVLNKRIAFRHRLSIGTIVSDQLLSVRMGKGEKIGNIEASFIAKLKPGQAFWFAGRNLEVTKATDEYVQVKKSNQSKGIVASWMGGRMPLSSELSAMLRKRCAEVANGELLGDEMEKLAPLFEKQLEMSIIPADDEFLIEIIQSKNGYHLFAYPFEGRLVHEGMAALFAYRMGQIKPLSCSIAMNDYGFELHSDEPFPLEEAITNGLFSTENLIEDIFSSVNAGELARKQFNEICRVSGLTFQGFPGKPIASRHLRASVYLLFKVFSEYDSSNLLLKQSYNQVLERQLDEQRIRKSLQRIKEKHWRITYPEGLTPFCFPIYTDGLREKLSTETIDDHIKKLKLQQIIT